MKRMLVIIAVLALVLVPVTVFAAGQQGAGNKNPCGQNPAGNCTGGQGTGLCQGAGQCSLEGSGAGVCQGGAYGNAPGAACQGGQLLQGTGNKGQMASGQGACCTTGSAGGARGQKGGMNGLSNQTRIRDGSCPNR